MWYKLQIKYLLGNLKFGSEAQIQIQIKLFYDSDLKLWTQWNL